VFIKDRTREAEKKAKKESQIEMARLLVKKGKMT
jgi:hypothetical protein